jgi:hypothetical protein
VFSLEYTVCTWDGDKGLLSELYYAIEECFSKPYGPYENKHRTKCGGLVVV